jgi:sulfonate transport system permease protein
MTHQDWRRAAIGLLVPLAIVFVWSAGAKFNWWPQSIISSPIAAARAWWRLLASGELITHTFVSLTRLLVGCGLGLLLGLLTASLVGLSSIFAKAFRPTLDFLTPIPVLAWIPILIVAFGIDGAKVSLIALGTGLIMYSTTLTVIADTKAEYVDVARLYNKRAVQVLTQISLPSGAWSLLGGLRMAFGLSWILLLASELIASSEGLGWLIWDSRNFSRADEMMAAMLWVGCLGFTCDYLLARVQSRVTRWRPTFHGLE